MPTFHLNRQRGSVGDPGLATMKLSRRWGTRFGGGLGGEGVEELFEEVGGYGGAVAGGGADVVDGVGFGGEGGAGLAEGGGEVGGSEARVL